MSETPDKITFNKNDVDKLAAIGKRGLKVGSLHWPRKDTVGFFIHTDRKVILYINDTHKALEEDLKFMAEEAFVAPNDFNKQYTTHVDEAGNINVVDIRKKRAPVVFYGLENTYKNNPSIVVRKYLQENRRYFRAISIRGDVPDTNTDIARAPVPAGRVWIKKEIVSFWNDKNDVAPYLKLLFGFLEAIKVNRSSCIYEFLDVRGFFTYKELFNSKHDKEELSPEETSALLKIQHVDPKAKAKLASPEFKDAMLKKAGKGFSAAAMARAATPELEEAIKLKTLVGNRNN